MKRGAAGSGGAVPALRRSLGFSPIAFPERQPFNRSLKNATGSTKVNPTQNINGMSSTLFGRDTGGANGNAPQKINARSGDTLADIAHLVGVSFDELKAANPHLPNPDWLLENQEINLPTLLAASEPDLAAATGVAGAVGRDALVHRVMDRAYEAGRNAPQGSFSGEVFRGLPTAHEAGVLNHTFGSPGRYNDAQSRLLYFSPTEAGSVSESHAYQGMKNRSIVQLDLIVTPDASGLKGISDIREGLRQQGLSERAITLPKGGSAPNMLHILLGEHPYGLSQQVGKGVQDAGASAMKAPAAVGGDQINVVPRNATTDQLSAVSARSYDKNGNPGIQRQQPAVDPMPVNDRLITNGRLAKLAGELASAHESPKVPKSLGEEIKFRLTDADDGYPRASGMRYGAAGGVAATAIEAGVAYTKGEKTDVSQLAGNMVTNGALGAGAAKATDLLTPKVGTLKAGGIAGGAIESVVSTVQNAEDFSNGKISASTATANVIVDTGVAVASGTAGAAVGAAVGSVVPVAGTAIGAATGFAVGMGTSYAIQAAGRITGAFDAAKSSLADSLSKLEQPLAHTWESIASGIDTTKAAAANAVAQLNSTP
ncbi:Hypothetical protein HDN1F_19960 [gamma proteobacterium HdN1]|nr:Hypothetical protein HDN1F_19960 [gamma proteobacterium HdN1]